MKRQKGERERVKSVRFLIDAQQEGGEESVNIKEENPQQHKTQAPTHPPTHPTRTFLFDCLGGYRIFTLTLFSFLQCLFTSIHPPIYLFTYFFFSPNSFAWFSSTEAGGGGDEDGRGGRALIV